MDGCFGTVRNSEFGQERRKTYANAHHTNTRHDKRYGIS